MLTVVRKTDLSCSSCSSEKTVPGPEDPEEFRANLPLGAAVMYPLAETTAHRGRGILVCRRDTADTTNPLAIGDETVVYPDEA